MKFEPQEIRIIIALLIFGSIIPLLPNHTVDPWELFNPRNFAILIITIASIQFSSYLAIKIFGERFGIAITGFLGGLVSSTAVFANLGYILKKHGGFTLAIMGASVLATVAMLLEISVIIFVASPTLLFYIIEPIFVMMAVGLSMSILLLFSQRKLDQPALSPKADFNLLSIFRISFFIAVVLILISVAERSFGKEGTEIIAFLTGLVEIHGISLATTLVYLNNQLSLQNAASILYTAILASFISKLFLLWTLTPAQFALKTSGCLIGILLCGGFVYFIYF